MVLLFCVILNALYTQYCFVRLDSLWLPAVYVGYPSKKMMYKVVDINHHGFKEAKLAESIQICGVVGLNTNAKLLRERVSS